MADDAIVKFPSEILDRYLRDRLQVENYLFSQFIDKDNISSMNHTHKKYVSKLYRNYYFNH